MRAAIHYVLAVAILGIYGGKVCPFIDTLSVGYWVVLLSLLFGAAFVLRREAVRRSILPAPYDEQAGKLFVLDMSLFALTALFVGISNMAVWAFPLGSGLKIVIGAATLGFFAATDISLEREREIAAEFHRTGREISPRDRYFPLTKKFVVVTAVAVTSLVCVVFLIMARDLLWIETLPAGKAHSAKLYILVEMLFVAAVYLAELLNLVFSYSRNLALFFDSENRALRTVAQGEYDARVVVSTNDEFGHMGHYTNRMIVDLKERTQALYEARLEILYRLGRAAEFRDNETGMHVLRMSHYSAALAQAAGLDAKECSLILQASPLHDIGKIGIPDAVLLKPGKLNDEEWAIMKSHVKIGGEILDRGNSEILRLAQTIALTHHEKWNGTGYPHGLREKEIPPVGRIVPIADVFDALTTERPYKNAWTIEDAMALIEKESGQHFDPALVPVFKTLLPEILKIRERFAEQKAHHPPLP